MNINKEISREEKHLLHFAGEKGGKSPISRTDRNWTAPSAAKHPIGNTICSSIVGSIEGIGLTAFGLLAYPFINNEIRNSIISTGASVCVPCGINSHSFMQLILKIYQNSKEYRAMNWVEQVKASFEGTLGAAAGGIVVGGKCLVDPELQLGCRLVNYVVPVWDTLQENFITIAAATAVAGLGLSYLQKKSYEKDEIKAENELIAKLETVYQNAADKLLSRNGYQEEKAMYELAGKILNRRVEIKGAVSSLELPSLNARKINDLTKPLFDAATQIRSKNMA